MNINDDAGDATKTSCKHLVCTLKGYKDHNHMVIVKYTDQNSLG